MRFIKKTNQKTKERKTQEELTKYILTLSLDFTFNKENMLIETHVAFKLQISRQTELC